MAKRGSGAGGAIRGGVRAILPGLLLALLPALIYTACERPGRDAGGAAPDAGGNPPGAAAPYPEQAQLGTVIAETRAILPRIPTGATPLAFPAGPVAAAPAARLVLVGTGRLLRPSAFPALPQALRMDVYLDDRTPPGGYLLVADGRRNGRWPVLDSRQTGNRGDAFAITLRVSDDEGRLRYLTLLGVPYESGGERLRSLEGYLIHPASGGAVSAEGAIYPLDFGYRHPEPPEPIAGAERLAEQVQALPALAREREAQGVRLADLQDAARRLRETPVPAEQAARQRQDLRRFAEQIAAAQAERAAVTATLRERLTAVYRERAALAEAWLAFAESNAYRWRTSAQRRAAYLPLQTLRAAYPRLEQLYGALDRDSQPQLAAARQAMEGALLREQERVPGAGD